MSSVCSKPKVAGGGGGGGGCSDYFGVKAYVCEQRNHRLRLTGAQSDRALADHLYDKYQHILID